VGKAVRFSGAGFGLSAVLVWASNHSSRQRPAQQVAVAELLIKVFGEGGLGRNHFVNWWWYRPPAIG
jgi:hypothetical protein